MEVASKAPFALSIAGLLIVGCLISYRRLSERYDVSKLPGPPCKLAHWLWGHEKLLNMGGLLPTYTKWAAAFGGLYKIKGALFHSDIIVATDYSAAHHLFQNPDIFVKAPQMRAVIETLVGESIITAEHAQHKRYRRLLNGAFSPEVAKSTAPDILLCTEALERQWMQHLLSNNGTVELDVADGISKCTLNVIGRISFAYDFQEEHADEAEQIRRAWSAQAHTANTFPGVVALFVLRAFPWILSLPIPLAGDATRLRDIVERAASEILRGGQGHEKGRDALSILQRASEAEGAARLSDKEIVSNIAGIIMAGHDTTATALDLTLYELAKQRDIQERLRKEIRSAGPISTWDEVQQLEYLDAVVKEVLRLHPSITHAERMALQDAVIPLSKPLRAADGTEMSSVSVRAGQIIHIPYMSMNVNPDVWGVDAASFVPDRWIVPGGVPPMSQLPHGWGGIATFGDGPRLCIGYRVALLQIKLILVSLIRTFEFQELGLVVEEKYRPTLAASVDGRIGYLPLRVSLAAA